MLKPLFFFVWCAVFSLAKTFYELKSVQIGYKNRFDSFNMNLVENLCLFPGKLNSILIEEFHELEHLYSVQVPEVEQFKSQM